MSFTTTVKEELLAKQEMDPYQLAALIKLSGSLGLTGQGLTLSITTENAKLARHLYHLLSDLYQVKPESSHHQKTNLKKNRVYSVQLTSQVEAILSDLQLADAFFGFERGIAAEVLADDEAGRAYLRGAFLATGTLRDPESGKYQLEIHSVYQDHAEDLAALMQKFMLDAKVIAHKNGAMTYLQKAEDIMDFLIVIGAMAAKESFEEVKILRETRNDLNRATNAEAANIARTISASMKTINNIAKIMETVGLESLPEELQQVARLRVTHPEYSIQDLADQLPDITKSGVNHRLRKLNKLADSL